METQNRQKTLKEKIRDIVAEGLMWASVLPISYCGAVAMTANDAENYRIDELRSYNSRAIIYPDKQLQDIQECKKYYRAGSMAGFGLLLSGAAINHYSLHKEIKRKMLGHKKRTN